MVVIQQCRVKAADVNTIQDSHRHMNSYLCLLSYEKQLSVSNSSKVDVLTWKLDFSHLFASGGNDPAQRPPPQ